MGGALAAAGERVTFLVRPSSANLIRTNGIAISGAMGVLSVPHPRIITDLPSALDNDTYDLIILAVKSFHTSAAVGALQSTSSQIPPVLSLQNGVDNEAMLADTLGIDHVIPGTLTTAVSSPEVGVMVVEKHRGIGLAAEHPLSPQIMQAFSAAGFHTMLYRNTHAMKWSKLLTNMLANASAAICDLSPEAIFAHDRLFELEITALRETMAVMHTMGIPVVRLPGTPSHWLGFAIQHLPTWSYRSLLSRKVASGRGDKPPSLHVDLSAQRGNSEVNFLNGAVARHAKVLGIATPVNSRIAHLLAAIVSGEVPWDHYRANPDRLADQLLSGDI